MKNPREHEVLDASGELFGSIFADSLEDAICELAMLKLFQRYGRSPHRTPEARWPADVTLRQPTAEPRREP